MSEIKIYTDGGCQRKGGPRQPGTYDTLSEAPGSWAWRAEYPDGTVREEVGSEYATTNNRMEMMAAIKAMEALPMGAKALIFTDSQYLQQGFMVWWRGWKERDWRTGEGKPVKNRELWERMLHASRFKAIRMTWVKGHNGTPSNERVDSLCTAELRRITGRQSKAERRTAPPLRCPICRLALSLVTIEDRPHWTCIAWAEHPAAPVETSEEIEA